jgi:pectate lyase
VLGLATLLSAIACGSPGSLDAHDASSSHTGSPFEIAPPSPEVAPGHSVQFAAPAVTQVAWAVQEPNGGTVTVAGLYTAPATTGTYHVVATSTADTSQRGSATVTVTAPTPPPSGVVPAFPEAQGGGALSKGGRGGVVYEVTNLDDSGAGSLRACVEASGARTCVFRVAGTITLLSPMNVYNPYLTVAGQTAPGGGIQLSGKSIMIADNMVNIRTHDVVWRYTKLRKGYTTVVQYAGAIDVFPGAYNVIMDHNSVAWVESNSAGSWANWDPAARSITWSWNIWAEPLASHATGFLTGANSRALADTLTDLDLHHNLFQNSNHRNPLLKNKSSRVVNNIIYNYCFYATQIGGGVSADIIGNFYKAGPRLASDPGCTGYQSKREIEVYPAGNDTTPNGSPSLYVTGNKSPHLSDPASDNWAIVYEVSAENGSETGSLSTTYRRTTPLPTAGVPITADPVGDLEARMMPTVGASQRLGCDGRWVANRDSLDARLVDDYYAMRGTLPTTENDVGGFPTIATGTPCVDSDHDGIPDAWETAHGLNPNDPSDGRQLTSSGYTNLEVYLNGTY